MSEPSVRSPDTTDMIAGCADVPGARAAIAALGRTDEERVLLQRAFEGLERDHGFDAKAAAEPQLRAIAIEFVTRLMVAFGSLASVRDTDILDIASGSNSSRSPVTGRRTAMFEPWMCRLLVQLGARPVAVDIGDLEGEPYAHFRLDLGMRGSLDFLPDRSFDAIHESRLFGSPEFREAHGDDTDRVRAEIHRQERRLLRPQGVLIHSDGRRSMRRTRPG